MSKNQTGMVQSVKMFFGFFMVLVYVGVAIMMALNLLDWPNTPMWNTIRWIFAVVFGLYGIYRGYREIKGEHTYGMRVSDEDERYSTYDKSDNSNEQE
jgi:hypothetical protein